MRTLQRMQPISLLILGSVFSDCVVFYGDISCRQFLKLFFLYQYYKSILYLIRDFSFVD